MKENEIQGVILRAISSFFYVDTPNGEYECRARGIFKHKNQNLVVGDKVKFSIIDEDTKKGLILESIKRDNLMIRPPIANVTQAILVFSVKSPAPNLGLIDRFIVLAAAQGLDIVICFSKMDLDDENQSEEMLKVYRAIGYPVIPISTPEGLGVEDMKQYLNNHISIVAGPSGSGKSTLINALVEEVELKTGDVSAKIGRGKHTTRHVNLIKIDKNSLIADSPGFSTVTLEALEIGDLKEYFIEFHDFDVDCRFGSDCLHENEPDCEVKLGVSEGKISEVRYKSYLQLLNELRDQKKRRKY